MNTRSILALEPRLEKFISTADYVDIHTIESRVSMREFIAGALSFYPVWLRLLYRIRLFLVHLLRIGSSGIPLPDQMLPGKVPMNSGEICSFFKVAIAEEDRFWLAGISESHLTAYIGVVVNRLQTGNRFHFLTIVRYHRWNGPIYFKIIRPFHKLTIIKMIKAGAKETTRPNL